nr:hypothetical protein CFP56_27609 [Quercus suber]
MNRMRKTPSKTKLFGLTKIRARPSRKFVSNSTTDKTAGMAAAHSLIGETNALLSKPNHMKPSLIEAGARLFVTRFLGTYISAGCLILLEEGDTILTFEGDKRKCSMKIVLKVHTPQFYWKCRIFSTPLTSARLF